MPITADPKENRLLAALPQADWLRLQPMIEAVDLPLGRVLYESGTKLSHIYFPTTAIISLLYVMDNGASSEIAVVGKEGVVGISLFMGGRRRQAVRSCKAPVMASGSGLTGSRKSSITPAPYFTCCCVIPRR